MTIKAPTSEQLQDALSSGLKGAAAGAVLGPVGAVVGGVGGTLAALVSDLVPGLVLPSSTKPAVADAAAFITASPTEAGQVAALKQDPAAAEKFKSQVVQIAAEEQQKRDDRDDRIQQMLLDRAKLDQEDTANARQQTVQLAQAGSAIAYGAPIVSGIILLAFATLAIMVLLREVPEGNRDIANIMLGTLGTMAAHVVGYWVGSSSESRVKTALLAQSVPASLLPTPAAVVPAADVPTSKQ